MDNLIYYGDIEPFIVVTPNGRRYESGQRTLGNGWLIYGRYADH